MDGAALDRAGADDRDLDGQVLDVLGARAGQHLHLRAALDLEDAGRLGGADPPVDLGVVERDPREVDPLGADPGDLGDGALDRREHPEAEQVDLQEAGVGAGVLVPLGDLPALHRGRHDRAEVGQRPGREHHPTRVLGGVAGETVGVVEQLPQATASVASRRRSPPPRSGSPTAPPARSRRAAGPGPCRSRGSRPSTR